jgi:hypothetical protein
VLDVSADTSDKPSEPRRLIGLLDLRATTLRGHVTVPANMLPLLLQLLVADQLHYAIVQGSKLRYRSATIRQCQFCRSLDENEDLPEF